MTPTRTRSSAASPTASTPRAASPATASCSRPAVGRALAEEILGERAERSTSRPYRLERFAGERRRSPRRSCSRLELLADLGVLADQLARRCAGRRLVVPGVARSRPKRVARPGRRSSRSPSTEHRAACARSSSSVVIESREAPEQRAGRSLVRHAGRRQLRDQLLDLPQHVGLVVPEVVEVGVQRRAQQPQLVVGRARACGSKRSSRLVASAPGADARSSSSRRARRPAPGSSRDRSGGTCRPRPGSPRPSIR